MNQPHLSMGMRYTDKHTSLRRPPLAPLCELRGTFLEVSARYAPPAYTLRRVADAFDQWAVRQPVARLTRVYEHLIEGRLDPQWEELGLPPSL